MFMGTSSRDLQRHSTPYQHAGDWGDASSAGGAPPLHSWGISLRQGELASLKVLPALAAGQDPKGDQGLTLRSQPSWGKPWLGWAPLALSGGAGKRSRLLPTLS